MADQVRQAWDRLEGESSWDFARFRRYRDLGAGRSIPKAVRLWLAEPGPKVGHRKRFRTGADPEDYVRRVSWRWQTISRSWSWRRRVALFDERVEAEARQRLIVEHVEEEAEQMRLRIVAARRLRANGLAVGAVVARRELLTLAQGAL